MHITRRISGILVFVAGVLLIVNIVSGNYLGLYIRYEIMPKITFFETRDKNMHTLPFNNTELKKLVDLEKKSSDGFLNIYNISNGRSLSVWDRQNCVNVKSNPVYKACLYDTKIDVHISGGIRRIGQWEGHIMDLLYSVVKQRKQLTFVDIGANIGYFSLLLASLGHYAVAVEPWEQHLQKFAQAIYLNHFQNNIVVLRNAVSNYHRVGYIDIHLAKIENQGGARLLPNNDNVASTGTITTSTILLDDLAPLIPTKDIILKFDIEGHECRAIEKSDLIFDNFHVILILTEWGVMTSDMNNIEADIACSPDNIQQMADMLSSRGFMPYTYPDTLLDVKECRSWTYMDVYWKPKEKVSNTSI